MASSEITHETIKTALHQPSDFGWFGRPEMFKTWGLCGPSMTRDSSPLDESNFEVICKDLEERFPDETERVHMSHWAVGWIDTLAVHVIEDGKPTPAFEALIEWRERLDEYPVADDDDYAEREAEYEALTEEVD